MEKQIRREENNLVVIGTGLIAFGGWLLIKILMIYYLQYDTIVPATPDMSAMEQLITQIVSAVILCLFIAISLGLRLYVGLSAIAEGNGKKKSHVYIGFAVFLALAELLSIGLDVYGFSHLIDTAFDAITDIVIDLSSIYVLIVMIVSATRLRKLRRLSAAKGA